MTYFMFKAWQDEFLVWDPSQYGGIEVLRVPFDKIWTPGNFYY